MALFTGFYKELKFPPHASNTGLLTKGANTLKFAGTKG